MAEWRLLRGWSDAELSSRLDQARTLPRNFDESEAGMTPERGWSRHHSTAVIAAEPPGPPVSGGPFERAWEQISRFAFSDPRIVKGHFNPSAPLERRVMLNEVLIWGLRYLNPVMITAVRIHADEQRTTRGFRYETLQGHFETGLEWFLLVKEHRSGEVTFTIHAGWRGGQLPNWWSKLGFKLLAPRYQRAWHRLAHLRLRQLVGSTGLAPLPRGKQLVTQGPPLPVFTTVQAAASGAPPGPIQSERDETPAVQPQETT
jgi:uncharacterized protein (UPF0548 family)